MKTSIQYDIDRVRRRVGERKIKSVTEWAGLADVSRPTIFKFLDGGELLTSNVDKILRPLGLVAADIVKISYKRRCELARIARRRPCSHRLRRSTIVLEMD